MTGDLKPSAAELAGQPFNFTGTDGATHTLPQSSAITASMVRRHASESDLGLTFSVLEELCTPETLAALDDLPFDAYSAVLAAWHEHLGVDPRRILTLITLIGEHETAFAYDWRTRFGLPLESVFDGRMSWGEAWSLTQTLAGDPSSRVAAAIAGWQHPMSRESMVLADLFDVTVRVNSDPKRAPAPYPRGWDRPSPRLGPGVSQARVRAALIAAGH